MNLSHVCLFRNYLIFACCAYPRSPPLRSDSPEQDGGSVTVIGRVKIIKLAKTVSFGAVASRQCDRFMGPDIICGLSLLLVLVPALRFFSGFSSLILSPEKPTSNVKPLLNKVDFVLSSARLERLDFQSHHCHHSAMPFA